MFGWITGINLGSILRILPFLAILGVSGYAWTLRVSNDALKADIVVLRLSVAGCQARVGFLLEGEGIEDALENADPDDLARRASEWLLETGEGGN